MKRLTWSALVAKPGQLRSNRTNSHFKKILQLANTNKTMPNGD